MGYCTIDDIRKDFKGIVFKPYDALVPANNSATSEETLQEWIDQESAYIDGKINQVVTLPIDLDLYTQAALILKRICIFRVSARVKNKNELKEELTQRSSDEKYLQNFARTPNDDLEAIRKGTLILIDVPVVNTGDFQSFYTDNNGCCKPTFNTCRQQW